MSRLSLGLTQPPKKSVLGDLSLGINLLLHEADHSIFIECRGQEWWSYTSNHPMCLCNMVLN
jgi:hypothetical protein